MHKEIENKYICNIFDLGDTILIETPGTYSMDAAIRVLEYLDSKHQVVTQDTGWKHGYGFAVAVDNQIQINDLVFALNTDGPSTSIRRITGNKNEVRKIILEVIENFPSKT